MSGKKELEDLGFTFPSDRIRLWMRTGMTDISMREIGLNWPPPMFIQIMWPQFKILDGRPDDRWPKDEKGLRDVMARVSMSKLTDDQSRLAPMVERVAEYKYLGDVGASSEEVIWALPQHVVDWWLTI